MRFMNEYDLEFAERRLDPDLVPNRARLVAAVKALRVWADRNSDGWAYWPKPATAANRAMSHIESTTNRDNLRREWQDISDTELALSLWPIRSFLTRQGADWKEILP